MLTERVCEACRGHVSLEDMLPAPRDCANNAGATGFLSSRLTNKPFQLTSDNESFLVSPFYPDWTIGSRCFPLCLDQSDPGTRFRHCLFENYFIIIFIFLYPIVETIINHFFSWPSTDRKNTTNNCLLLVWTNQSKIFFTNYKLLVLDIKQTLDHILNLPASLQGSCKLEFNWCNKLEKNRGIHCKYFIKQDHLVCSCDNIHGKCRQKWNTFSRNIFCEDH